MSYQSAKRIVDIFGAIVGLLCIAPLVPFIALAIALDSRGSIFVRLTRVSAGRIVNVYKFRSMIANADLLKNQYAHLNERTDGPLFKIRHDPRLTRVGKILRKFRIDEFPQLWNVAIGELSLVGPRPHEPEEAICYPPEYRHLVGATAGVTGLSQVNGSSSLPFLKELEFDDQYLRQRSLTLDARIILKTIVILFTDPTAV